MLFYLACTDSSLVVSAAERIVGGKAPSKEEPHVVVTSILREPVGEDIKRELCSLMTWIDDAGVTKKRPHYMMVSSVKSLCKMSFLDHFDDIYAPV